MIASASPRTGMTTETPGQPEPRAHPQATPAEAAGPSAVLCRSAKSLVPSVMAAGDAVVNAHRRAPCRRCCHRNRAHAIGAPHAARPASGGDPQGRRNTWRASPNRKTERTHRNPRPPHTSSRACAPWGRLRRPGRTRRTGSCATASPFQSSSARMPRGVFHSSMCSDWNQLIEFGQSGSADPTSLLSSAAPAPYEEGRAVSEYARSMRKWDEFESEQGVLDHVIRYSPRDYALFARMKQGDRYPEADELAGRRGCRDSPLTYPGRASACAIQWVSETMAISARRSWR